MLLKRALGCKSPKLTLLPPPRWLRWNSKVVFNALNESSWHWIYQSCFFWSNSSHIPLG